MSDSEKDPSLDQDRQPLSVEQAREAHNEAIRQLASAIGNDYDPSEREQDAAWVACKRTLDAFEAAVRAAVSTEGGHEWQPIETAPKDGSHIVLWCVDLVGGNGRVETGSWQPAYNGSWWDFGREYTLNPTHWMPLPPAPQEAE